MPHGDGARHKFSAFVDDSTLFLLEALNLPDVLKIVKRFGQLAGLRVQLRKSKFIFLNLDVLRSGVRGIPVLRYEDTTRYLGYSIGTGGLKDVNWAARIRNIQRRLATAAQLANSVELQFLNLNVIILPSILFTAAAIPLPS